MKKKIWNKHLNNNESGYMLISVTLIIVIISILGMSIMGITMNTVKTANSERDDQSVYYIAESGLTVEMENIKAEALKVFEEQIIPPFEICNNDNECIDRLKKDAAINFFNAFKSEVEGEKPFSGFEIITDTNKQPVAKITVTHLSTNEFSEEYKISSVGIIGSEKREVEQTFTVNWPGRYQDDPFIPEPEDPGGSIKDIPVGTAAYVNGDVEYVGGNVVGHIGTLKCNAINITGWVDNMQGHFFVPDYCESKDIKVNNEQLIVQGLIPEKAVGANVNNLPELPVFPDEPESIVSNEKIKGQNGEMIEIKDGRLWFEDSRTEYILKVKNNLKFEYIKFGHGNTLNIDTGDTDKNIIVNQLEVEGTLKNIGKGKLNIFVLDEMNIGGSGIIGENKEENLINILYSGHKKLSLNGNQRLYSSLYSKQANLTIGGSAELTGNIFSQANEINIKGHGDAISQVVLAPNAHVEITGSGKVIGVVFADSLYMSGGGERIVYKEGWIDEGPITIPKPQPEVPNEPDDFNKIERDIIEVKDPLIEVYSSDSNSKS